MTNLITTEHLNAALDLAEARGIAARDIEDLTIAGDKLRSIKVRAACAQEPKRRFVFELRVQP